MFHVIVCPETTPPWSGDVALGTSTMPAGIVSVITVLKAVLRPVFVTTML